MTDFDQRLLAAFHVEHREHLEHLRRLLAPMAQGQTSASDLDECLRRAHNLKGAARATGLRVIETLAHRMETVFARAGKGTLALDASVLRILQGAMDAIEDWVADHVAGKSPAAPAGELAALDNLLESSAPVDAAPSPPTAAPEAREAAARSVEVEDTVRIPVGSVDRLLAAAAQMAAEGPRQGILSDHINALTDGLVELSREFDRLSRTPSSHLARLVERLRVLSGEARQAQRLQKESAWAMETQSRRLQTDGLRVLMVPAREVFEGFPRLMRELARDLGKNIEFHMRGTDVQADRRVLQGLKDPLLHLLRNAASHGVETAAERSAVGKPPGGRVSLSVEAHGNQLQVRVDDDGRGIDFERVAHIAQKRGLIDEAEQAAPHELERILFAPGFSTSQVITEVSGRGIGLSVVQDALLRLQGEVRVEPSAEGGTSFVMSVPKSLSMQSLMLVSCRGQTFGLPTPSVERLHRLPLSEVQTVDGRAVTFIDSVPVSLWSLSHLLFPEIPASQVESEVLPLAVIRAGGRRLGVVVDAFVDRVSGVLKPLGPHGAWDLVMGGMVLGDGRVCLVLNASDLLERASSARPAAVFEVRPREDAPSPVMAAARSASPETGDRRSALPSPQKVPLDAAPCILVVDDSFTTRTLEKGILESNGYRVRIAVDGVEALQTLRSESIDLVIADIQMPRMDGFSLLAAIKSDARLRRIPVILVTSLETREDQERGLSLGADSYIVKRKFEQRDLLNAVRQLL